MTASDHKPHILVLSARFYDDISDALEEGATTALRSAGVSCEILTVPGALELPIALTQAITAGLIGSQFGESLENTKKYDGVVALGCVIRGETYHFEIVSNNANHWLMDAAMRNNIPVGNGILTVESHQQAKMRAQGGSKSKGADAARACLRLIEHRRLFRKRDITGATS